MIEIKERYVLGKCAVCSASGVTTYALLRDGERIASVCRSCIEAGQGPVVLRVLRRVRQLRAEADQAIDLSEYLDEVEVWP